MNADNIAKEFQMAMLAYRHGKTFDKGALQAFLTDANRDRDHQNGRVLFEFESSMALFNIEVVLVIFSLFFFKQFV